MKMGTQGDRTERRERKDNKRGQMEFPRSTGTQVAAQGGRQDTRKGRESAPRPDATEGQQTIEEGQVTEQRNVD
jgi:hypothetical protein